MGALGGVQRSWHGWTPGQIAGGAALSTSCSRLVISHRGGGGCSAYFLCRVWKPNRDQMGACGEMGWEFTAPSLFAHRHSSRSISLGKWNKLSPAVTVLMQTSPLGEIAGNSHGRSRTWTGSGWRRGLPQNLWLISRLLHLSWLTALCVCFFSPPQC